MEQKHASDKVGFLQSIKGKVMMMSILAILASVILGVAGLSALSRNDANNNVLSKINDISLLQYRNQSLETSYLYSLEDSYLGNILDNLTQMEDDASQAATLSSVNKNKTSRICRQAFPNSKITSSRFALFAQNEVFRKLMVLI